MNDHVHNITSYLLFWESMPNLSTHCVGANTLAVLILSISVFDAQLSTSQPSRSP